MWIYIWLIPRDNDYLAIGLDLLCSGNIVLSSIGKTERHYWSMNKQILFLLKKCIIEADVWDSSQVNSMEHLHFKLDSCFESWLQSWFQLPANVHEQLAASPLRLINIFHIFLLTYAKLLGSLEMAFGTPTSNQKFNWIKSFSLETALEAAKKELARVKTKTQMKALCVSKSIRWNYD